MPAHEARLLARAVAALPGTHVITTAHRVMTSVRLASRAPYGVGADLRVLDDVGRTATSALAG